MIALTAALLLAATPAAKVDYQGPLGLKWGMTPAEVKSALEDRFELYEEGETDAGVTLMQRYRGAFADFATDAIEIYFWEGKFLMLGAVLSPKDPRPLMLLWESAGAAMASTYGPPGSITGLPRMTRETRKDRRPASALYRTAAEKELEEALLSRREIPTATWIFHNGARGVVSFHVASGAVDASDIRVVWMFSDGARFKAWEEAVAKANPPDF